MSRNSLGFDLAGAMDDYSTYSVWQDEPMKHEDMLRAVDEARMRMVDEARREQQRHMEQEIIYRVERMAQDRVVNVRRNYNMGVTEYHFAHGQVGCVPEGGDYRHMTMMRDPRMERQCAMEYRNTGSYDMRDFYQGVMGTFQKALAPIEMPKEKKKARCTSCGTETSDAHKIDDRGMCRERRDSFWKKVRKLYWHRYAKTGELVTV